MLTNPMPEHMRKTAALYIHIPFCEQRCSYCDFYTVANRKNAIPGYVEALLKEIEVQAESELWKRQQFSTVFFGGGTPSLLTADQLASILTAVRSRFRFIKSPEVSIEMNPGTANSEKLGEFHGAGINRLSIGAQSFFDDELQQVERIHTAHDIDKTVVSARKAGFQNLSLDLIFALPGQRPSRWKQNLEHAIALEPEHLSTYNLTIEKGTPLHRKVQEGTIKKATEWRERALYNYTIDFLENHNYAHYEISNFAKPGRLSQHNYKYWDGSLYLGVGASASTFTGTARLKNRANYVHYVDKINRGQLPIETTEMLTQEQRQFEVIFLGLRLTEGIDIAAYDATFKQPFMDAWKKQVQMLTAGSDPLCELHDNHLMLTRQGKYLCDTVCTAFLQY